MHKKQFTKATILAIEDEISILKFLRNYLESKQFKFIEAATAEKGIALVESQKPDIILLDLNLPDRDGLEVIKHLRQWTSIPIIIISARGQERDKVLGLDFGADDYLTKPFNLAELSARIRVALRHTQYHGEEMPIFKTGELRVDLVHHQVILKGKQIHLTPIQYQLLAILVRNAGKVVTQQQLLKEIWGTADSNADYARIYIHQLRHKLESDPARPKYLRTEPGIGYRLWV